MSLESIQGESGTPTPQVSCLKIGHHPSIPGVAHSQVKLNAAATLKLKLSFLIPLRLSAFPKTCSKFISISFPPSSTTCSFQVKISQVGMQAVSPFLPNVPQVPALPLPQEPHGSSQAVGTAEIPGPPLAFLFPLSPSANPFLYSFTVSLVLSPHIFTRTFPTPQPTPRIY